MSERLPSEAQMLEEEVARLRDLLHQVDELLHLGGVAEGWHLIQQELENEAGATTLAAMKDSSA